MAGVPLLHLKPAVREFYLTFIYHVMSSKQHLQKMTAREQRHPEQVCIQAQEAKSESAVLPFRVVFSFNPRSLS